MSLILVIKNLSYRRTFLNSNFYQDSSRDSYFSNKIDWFYRETCCKNVHYTIWKGKVKLERNRIGTWVPSSNARCIYQGNMKLQELFQRQLSGKIQLCNFIFCVNNLRFSNVVLIIDIRHDCSKKNIYFYKTIFTEKSTNCNLNNATYQTNLSIPVTQCFCDVVIAILGQSQKWSGPIDESLLARSTWTHDIVFDTKWMYLLRNIFFEKLNQAIVYNGI